MTEDGEAQNKGFITSGTLRTVVSMGAVALLLFAGQAVECCKSKTKIKNDTEQPAPPPTMVVPDAPTPSF